MALKFNSTEVENVYYNGTKVDRVFFNNALVYESTIYVDKPTLSGVFVYDKTVKQVTVTGYDSTAMTLSGAIEATEAGTYHAYFTLNKGYAWTDGTTDKLDLTWTINKRPIAIPSLSGTSFATTGNYVSPAVNNFDSTYVTQSGTISSNVLGSYTVTWTLKDTNNCCWFDGSTTQKTQTWSTYGGTNYTITFDWSTLVQFTGTVSEYQPWTSFEDKYVDFWKGTTTGNGTDSSPRQTQYLKVNFYQKKCWRYTSNYDGTGSWYSNSKYWTIKNPGTYPVAGTTYSIS